jgi:hypothetical protein
VLFALPAAGVTGLVYVLFGERAAANTIGVLLSLGFGGLIRHVWMTSKRGARRKG